MKPTLKEALAILAVVALVVLLTVAYLAIGRIH